jgi:phage terminase small subunit
MEDNTLNEKQKLFCKYFVSEDFFANGFRAYCKAYNIDPEDFKKAQSARVRASELLTNSNILIYINTLLDEAGLNDSFVDKQLLIAITQNADFGSKVKAIAEYNKLKQRIVVKSKIEHSGGISANFGNPIQSASEPTKDS